MTPSFFCLYCKFNIELSKVERISLFSSACVLLLLDYRWRVDFARWRAGWGRGGFLVARLPRGEVTGYPLKHRTSFVAITSCSYLVYHERLKVVILIFFVFIFALECSCFSFKSYAQETFRLSNDLEDSRFNRTDFTLSMKIDNFVQS